MLRKRKKVKNYHEFYVRLQNLLEVRYNPWGDLTDKQKLEGNRTAKQTLYTVYKELTNVLPDVGYKSGRSHTSYLFQLLPIKKALDQGEYMIVVWELGSLFHSEPFLQPRMYYNVVRILEQRLEIEGGSFKMRRFFHRKDKLKNNRTRDRWEVRPAPAGYELRNTMNLLQGWLKKEENVEDKILLIDFLMSVIREDLQTDILSTMLYTKEHSTKDLPLFMFPSPCYDQNGREFRIESDVDDDITRTIDLATDCVIVLPWVRERFREAIVEIISKGFRRDPGNHHAQYYKYMDISYAHNGRHSIGVGAGLKEGTIQAVDVDVGILFDHLHTDGEQWYNSHTNEPYNMKVFDFRFAILYELAKMKYRLQESDSE